MTTGISLLLLCPQYGSPSAQRSTSVTISQKRQFHKHIFYFLHICKKYMNILIHFVQFI